jgi:hypothetical protein
VVLNIITLTPEMDQWADIYIATGKKGSKWRWSFIACGFRKYENLFTHEYHIPIGRCPQGI